MTNRKTVAAAKAAPNPMMLYRLVMIIFMAAAIYLTFVPVVYAQTVTPMGNVLCNVIAMVAGNLGRGIITLAICVVGVGATLGKVQWGMALTVAVGCSIIANATNIMFLLLPQLQGNTGCP